jgi:methionyl-tRNA formyltransferase
MSTETLEKVVLFGADTARSRAYLSLLIESGLRPAACVLLAPQDVPRASSTPTPLFDNVTPLSRQAADAGVPVTEVATGDINAAEVVAALAACPQTLVAFSGPAGTLVKAPLFATGKTFLHVHPGKLPQYRGSTVMYYSLLAEEKIWVSALVLDPQIDQGPVVDVMEAEVPADRSLIDQIYDPVIRARLLVRVLSRYRDSGRLTSMARPIEEGRTYFVIHPVLKHIAIQSRAPAPRDCAPEAG